jgi:hypothetical protein
VELGNYWEREKIDLLNYCPQRGEFPHIACKVELYEMGGSWSHLHGLCHGHKTIWHLQSGGRSWPELPTLDELADEGYEVS